MNRIKRILNAISEQDCNSGVYPLNEYEADSRTHSVLTLNNRELSDRLDGWQTKRPLKRVKRFIEQNGYEIDSYGELTISDENGLAWYIDHNQGHNLWFFDGCNITTLADSDNNILEGALNLSTDFIDVSLPPVFERKIKDMQGVVYVGDYLPSEMRNRFPRDKYLVMEWWSGEYFSGTRSYYVISHHRLKTIYGVY